MTLFSFFSLIEPGELIYEGLLGKGASGSVFKGKWNNKDVAIKKFNPDTIDIKEFRTEVSIMRFQILLFLYDKLYWIS